MIFRRFHERSQEAMFLSALEDGYDGAIRDWLTTPYLSAVVRNAVASLTRDEAMAMIAHGGEGRVAAMAEHPNGRVREAALRALAPEDAASLPTLLRRANDWVPVIAQLATGRAAVVLPQADDATLLNSLPLVYALTRQGRADHGALVAAYLLQTRTRRGLARRMRRAYRNGPVGEWASWRVVGDEESAYDLTQERLKAGTPRLQFETARQVAAEPNRWRELLASRNPQVRRIALDHAPSEAVVVALDDPNAGVRNDARFLLGKRNYAEVYRARLPSPGAVSGLGETGLPDDVNVLRPLLNHPKAEIRARTVEGVFRLLGDDAEPFLLAMLQDPIVKVQRAAVEALIRLNVGFDPGDVLHWPVSSSLRLMLLQRTPRWAALLGVLREASSLDNVDEWLVRWAREMGYGRVPPKPDELAEVRQLLHESALRSGTTAALRDVLESLR